MQFSLKQCPLPTVIVTITTYTIRAESVYLKVIMWTKICYGKDT